MKYMLDTDSVSFALRGEGAVAERIGRSSRDDLCVSAVTRAELRFGADVLGSRRIHRALDGFFEGVQVLPFDADAADRFGKVAASLRKRGVPIGQLDAMIAAHAASRGLTVVTHNTRHFRRLRGLSVEDWY